MRRQLVVLLAAALLLCSATACSNKQSPADGPESGLGGSAVSEESNPAESASLSSGQDSSKDSGAAERVSSAGQSSAQGTSSVKAPAHAGASSVRTPSAASTSSKKEENTVTKTYKNPVAQRADDPWVIRHGGSYYYCYSGNGGVCVAKIDSLTNLSKDNGVTVWKPPAGKEYSQELWAPELHYLNGRWYIYVAADDGNNDNHRMFCLEGDANDPTKPFTLKGKLADDGDHWAIDGTVLNLSGKLYFIWSGWEGYTNVAQNIYIASMSNPWTLSSNRVLLSKPEHYFELNGTPLINEGPAVLQRDGKTFVAYSASGSWTDDYCLGLLTYKGGDPLKQASWEKAADPAFIRTARVFGPGHCSFTVSPDGTEDWMVYHANDVSGSGWSGRKGCIQKVEWKNGQPVFGRPLDFGTAAPAPSGE